MTDIAIFPIGADALQRVQTLALEIWPEAYAGILPADRIPPMLAEIYSLETLTVDITERSHRYLLARMADEDAGFASAYREDGRVWIKKLYVRSTIRGLGLGRRLMETAVAAFPGAASVGLFVNNGNSPAIGFYRSQGFTIEAEVPVRMGPYDFTDFVMGKTIG
jgi:diamine N-acetyltransferase